MTDLRCPSRILNKILEDFARKSPKRRAGRRIACRGLLACVTITPIGLIGYWVMPSGLAESTSNRIVVARGKGGEEEKEPGFDPSIPTVHGWHDSDRQKGIVCYKSLYDS